MFFAGSQFEIARFETATLAAARHLASTMRRCTETPEMGMGSGTELNTGCAVYLMDAAGELFRQN